MHISPNKLGVDIVLYVCNALTFETLHLESSDVQVVYIFRIATLSVRIEVIGSRSRSQEPKSESCVTCSYVVCIPVKM